MDLPERVAIAFIGAAIVATAGLGGAVAFELGMSSNSNTPTQVTAGLPGTGGATPTPGPSGSSGTSASAGSAGSGGTQGHSVTSGGGGSAAAAVAALSNQSIGVKNGVITVGGIYDESVVLDATVERDTVRAYFNQVNAAGGVNGYKFQLVDCDSAYDPTRGHQCSNQLLSQNVLAMVGPLSASSEQPEVPYLTSHGMPVIGGLGVPAEYGNPLSFPVSVDLAVGATAQGLHTADLTTLDGKKITAPGVVILDTNFTEQVKQYLLAALRSKGIEARDVITVQGTQADYTQTVLKLRSENVDSIISGLDPFSYARFFGAMQNQHFNVRFFASGLDKTSAEAEYGTEAFTTSESLTPLIEPVGHENVPAVAEYLNAVKKYYPDQVKALDVYSEGDWVAAKIFVEAIRRIGSQPVTRRSLVDALNTIQNFDTGLTVPLSYSPNNHDPNHCLQWIRRHNDSWETYSGWNCF